MTLAVDPADGTTKVLSDDIVPQMLQAVAGKYAGGPKSVRDYQVAIGDAVQNRAPFQALLLEMELSMQHGPTSVQCVNPPAVPPSHPA